MPPPGLVVQGTPRDEVIPPPYAPSYVIQPDDELRVVVLGNTELTSTSPVRYDGTITVPGAGEVKAGGLTPQELADIVESRLTHIVRQPEVDVLVVRTSPPSFYITGEVFGSGEKTYRRGMTVLQALALGGLRDTANLKSVLLMRRTGPTGVDVRRINIKDVLKGREGAVDPLLAPADVVYVPKTFVASWSQFMTQFVRRASDPLDLYTQAWWALNIASQNVRITFR
jgi:polysaccharide export outer membrane protein